jgi:hypothetical protein
MTTKSKVSEYVTSYTENYRNFVRIVTNRNVHITIIKSYYGIFKVNVLLEVFNSVYCFILQLNEYRLFIKWN